MKRILFVLFSCVFVSTAYAEPSSFTRLMAAGQAVECTFEKPDGSQKGTIYVAEQKMRGDFIMKESGSEFPMHMIRDTQKMYTWGGPMGESQGMILPINMLGANPMGASQEASMNEEMDFTCKPWAAGSSQFEPPADVAFQDLGQMMSGMGQQS